MTGNGDRRSEVPGTSAFAWLAAGAIVIAAGTALGWDANALAIIVTPPAIIRAGLIGVSVGIALILLAGALNRLGAGFEDGDAGGDGGGSGGDGSRRDIATMIRGVRFVFLAVAALAAASGWLLGHPLPLVVALVIAGVDVLETSFLLIVVGLRGER